MMDRIYKVDPCGVDERVAVTRRCGTVYGILTLKTVIKTAAYRGGLERPHHV